MATRTYCSICGEEIGLLNTEFYTFQDHTFPICNNCRDKKVMANSTNAKRKEKATEYFLNIMEKNVGPNSKPLIKNILGERVTEEELNNMDMKQTASPTPEQRTPVSVMILSIVATLCILGGAVLFIMGVTSSSVGHEILIYSGIGAFIFSALLLAVVNITNTVQHTEQLAQESNQLQKEILQLLKEKQ